MALIAADIGSSEDSVWKIAFISPSFVASFSMQMPLDGANKITFGNEKNY